MNICIRNNERLRVFSTLILFLCSQILMGADTFTRCRIGKSKLQWGEACHITLEVYTRTWFTEGVSFPTMSGQNGVLLKQDRSYTSSETINGERYSVIAQDYLYYPLSVGRQGIRFDGIEVQTPPVGEYKGKKQSLSFSPKTIEVSTADAQNLRQTTALRLKTTQHFEMPDTLRVGDVVTRHIEYVASGVPAAFIVMPEFKDTLSYARLVQEQPVYLTELRDGQVVGRATQKILYQLIDSGTFTLPFVEVDYWLSKSRRMERLILKDKEIHVLPSVYRPDISPEFTASEPEDLVSRERLKRMIRVGVILVLCSFLLYVVHHRKSICGNMYWQMLKSSDYPQLYDILYRYARSLHYDNFQSLADEYANLQRWYSTFGIKLFKEGYSGRVSWRVRIRLFYALIVRRVH